MKRLALALTLIFALLASTMVGVTTLHFGIAQGGTSAVPSTFYSSYNVIDNTNMNLIQCPSVYDGYLWIVQSHATISGLTWLDQIQPDTSGTAEIEQCNLVTGAVLQSALLNDSAAEVYAAFVLDGLVYVPGEAQNNPADTAIVIILNETNLKQVAVIPLNNIHNIPQIIYDSQRNLLELGTVTVTYSPYTGKFGIYTVPPSESTVTADYTWVQITSDPFLSQAQNAKLRTLMALSGLAQFLQQVDYQGR